MKNAKSSLQQKDNNGPTKRSSEIEEELRGIDSGKVKKTASAYQMETKAKTVQPEQVPISPILFMAIAPES